MMRDGETHKLHISPTRTYERIALHFSPAALLPADAADYLLAPFRVRPLGQFNRLPFPGSRTNPGYADPHHLRRSAEGCPSGHDTCVSASILFEITQTSGPWRTGDASAEAAQQQQEGLAHSLPGGIIEFINRDPAAVTGVDVLEEKVRLQPLLPQPNLPAVYRRFHLGVRHSQATDVRTRRHPRRHPGGDCRPGCRVQ